MLRRTTTRSRTARPTDRALQSHLSGRGSTAETLEELSHGSFHVPFMLLSLEALPPGSLLRPSRPTRRDRTGSGCYPRSALEAVTRQKRTEEVILEEPPETAAQPLDLGPSAHRSVPDGLRPSEAPSVTLRLLQRWTSCQCWDTGRPASKFQPKPPFTGHCPRAAPALQPRPRRRTRRGCGSPPV